MTSKVDAVVDVREPDDFVAQIAEHENINEFKIDKLSSADIVIRNVGFERKTMSDYSSSLIGKSDRDLYDQVEKMKEAFDHSYILVEADLSDAEYLPFTQVNPNSVKGSMASIEARHGIPVKMCSNSSLLIDKAIALARKHHEDPISSSIPTSSLSGKDEPFTKRVFACIDGIQKQRAEDLYKEYKSVEEILQANEEELKEIDGIGDKTAHNIYTSFR